MTAKKLQGYEYGVCKRNGIQTLFFDCQIGILPFGNRLAIMDSMFCLKNQHFCKKQYGQKNPPKAKRRFLLLAFSEKKLKLSYWENVVTWLKIVCR